MAKSWLKRTRQRIVRKFIQTLLKGLLLSIGMLPRRTGVALGGILGRTAFHLLPRERRRALKHINLALGAIIQPVQQQRIIKSCFQNLGKSLFEVLYLSRWTDSEIGRMVEIDGEQYLKEAMNRGRGVIFITGHLGNWELGAARLARQYHPTAIVAAPMYDSRVEELMVGVRQSHAIETIVRDHPNALRRLLAKLRQGGVLVLAIDQDTRTDGVFVPFFGREAYTPSGAAVLALRTGAAVVIGFSLRLPDERHRVVIRKPLDLIRTGDPSTDVRTNTARFTEIIEQFIRDYPEQWVWMHERWKTVKSS